ncbi:MAG: hypothetical protein LC750_16685 [Actinobacteria bacterium]|nr:hypothetical protein [Actinomycetota bacterium]
MTDEPDNADVVAVLRLELPALARCSRQRMATRLITIALDALPIDDWLAVLQQGIDDALPPHT